MYKLSRSLLAAAVNAVGVPEVTVPKRLYGAQFTQQL